MRWWADPHVAYNLVLGEAVAGETTTLDKNPPVVNEALFSEPDRTGRFDRSDRDPAPSPVRFARSNRPVRGDARDADGVLEVGASRGLRTPRMRWWADPHVAYNLVLGEAVAGETTTLDKNPPVVNEALFSEPDRTGRFDRSDRDPAPSPTRISSRRGPHARAHVHGLEVSTLPWGRVTDTREKKSPLPIYYPKVEGR
ncbi:hypothetical protein CRG98_032461 [Punica granatum]|uniref:Uncharacterized protein n=1 Tax=Punica granatum TaxID=22663 RepID=A0A2I0IT12_PUNGR|nr:hypothetical protein CRG98_032461 [Punica granatum]